MSEPRYQPGYSELLGERSHVLRTRLAEIFSAETPTAFVWEVGCGHGHFLNAFAAAHPHKLCVGVDLVGERVERAEKKRDRARLANLHFLRAEARHFLQCLPASARIAEVFILFPDPWPKSRHHKHRVLQDAFLGQMALHATADCRLHFRTDYAPYFADARAVIQQSAEWEEAPGAPWPFEFETVFQSRAFGHESLVASRRQVPISSAG